MTINKAIIYFTIIVVTCIIGYPTIYKVISENHQKLYKVNEKLVYESALRCIYDGKCTDNKVTLKQLYENKYLDNQIVDPVSKVIYSENSYVEIKKAEFTFYSM